MGSGSTRAPSVARRSRNWRRPHSRIESADDNGR
jgi:hypothetical protein